MGSRLADADDDIVPVISRPAPGPAPAPVISPPPAPVAALLDSLCSAPAPELSMSLPPPPPAYHDSRNFTLSPETTDCDSADLESELSVPSAGEGSYHSSGPRHTTMPILEVSSHPARVNTGNTCDILYIGNWQQAVH